MAIGSFEMFLIIDSSGDCAVGADLDAAETDYSENIGGSGARRVIKVTVCATIPEELEEVTVNVADPVKTLPLAAGADA